MKKVFITLILLIALSACTQQDKGPSLFENRLCGMACWNNIIVGKTTRDEFLEIVSTISNVDQNSIRISGDSNGSMFDETISFQFYRILGNEKSLIHISAKVLDQKIVLITFWGDFGLIFQDVVDAFGEPDFASSLWTFDGGINVHFINSLQGVEINSYFKNERASVSPNTEVNNLLLFSPDMYQIFLESDFLTGDYEGFILYPWTGYGKIEEHYWPPQ